MQTLADQKNEQDPNDGFCYETTAKSHSFSGAGTVEYKITPPGGFSVELKKIRLHAAANDSDYYNFEVYIDARHDEPGGEDEFGPFYLGPSFELDLDLSRPILRNSPITIRIEYKGTNAATAHIEYSKRRRPKVELPTTAKIFNQEIPIVKRILKMYKITFADTETEKIVTLGGAYLPLGQIFTEMKVINGGGSEFTAEINSPLEHRLPEAPFTRGQFMIWPNSSANLLCDIPVLCPREQNTILVLRGLGAYGFVYLFVDAMTTTHDLVALHRNRLISVNHGEYRIQRLISCGMFWSLGSWSPSRYANGALPDVNVTRDLLEDLILPHADSNPRYLYSMRWHQRDRSPVLAILTDEYGTTAEEFEGGVVKYNYGPVRLEPHKTHKIFENTLHQIVVKKCSAFIRTWGVEHQCSIQYVICVLEEVKAPKELRLRREFMVLQTKGITFDVDYFRLVNTGLVYTILANNTWELSIPMEHPMLCHRMVLNTDHENVPAVGDMMVSIRTKGRTDKVPILGSSFAVNFDPYPILLGRGESLIISGINHSDINRNFGFMASLSRVRDRPAFSYRTDGHVLLKDNFLSYEFKHGDSPRVIRESGGLMEIEHLWFGSASLTTPVTAILTDTNSLNRWEFTLPGAGHKQEKDVPILIPEGHPLKIEVQGLSAGESIIYGFRRLVLK